MIKDCSGWRYLISIDLNEIEIDNTKCNLGWLGLGTTLPIVLYFMFMTQYVTQMSVIFANLQGSELYRYVLFRRQWIQI